MGGWDKMASLLERMNAAEEEKERRAQLCQTGAFLWFCDYRPWQIGDLLADENGLINGQARWRWQRSHRKERFYRRPHSLRPVCGAKTRQGGVCQARVCLRSDGRCATRCRLHGGLSTGPKSPRRKNTLETRTRLFKALIEGKGIVDSCRAAGVSPTTLYRWIKQDAEFEQAANLASRHGEAERQAARSGLPKKIQGLSEE